jgi:hypothetical protein
MEKYKLLFLQIFKLLHMKTLYMCIFNEQEFVAVCRKTDYENNNIGDDIFLVYRNEWEDIGEYSTEEIELLLTKIENNTIELYPAPNNAVVIVKSIPYSRKSEYIELPKIFFSTPVLDTSSMN